MKHTEKKVWYKYVQSKGGQKWNRNRTDWTGPDRLTRNANKEESSSVSFELKSERSPCSWRLIDD